MPGTLFRTLAVGAALTLVACDDTLDKYDDDTAPDAGDGGAGDGGAGDGGAGDGGAGDGGAGDGGSSSSEDAPRVFDGDAWCYQHTTGEERWLWVVRATCDDPQGLDTIEPIISDAVTVVAGGSELATYALTCNEGECSANFDEQTDGVACSQATNFRFLIRVIDEDDNWSDPYEVMGRQGTDASGR